MSEQRNGNGLAGNGLAAGPAGLDPMAMLEQRHQQLKAQFGKLTEARQMLDHFRVELDQLRNLGDTVIPDDVIKASGRLVGHGFGSAAMAEILAGMPAVGGQPLAAWVARHDLDVMQREQQMDQIQARVGHHLAVAGLRGLAAQHLQEPLQSAGPDAS